MGSWRQDTIPIINLIGGLMDCDITGCDSKSREDEVVWLKFSSLANQGKSVVYVHQALCCLKPDWGVGRLGTSSSLIFLSPSRFILYLGITTVICGSNNHRVDSSRALSSLNNRCCILFYQNILLIHTSMGPNSHKG